MWVNFSLFKRLRERERERESTTASEIFVELSLIFFWVDPRIYGTNVRDVPAIVKNTSLK